MQNGPKSIRRGPRLILALLLGTAAAAGVYLYVGNIQQAAQQNARLAAQQAVSQSAAQPHPWAAGDALIMNCLGVQIFQ